jgi:hypothetical protein
MPSVAAAGRGDVRAWRRRPVASPHPEPSSPHDAREHVAPALADVDRARRAHRHAVEEPRGRQALEGRGAHVEAGRRRRSRRPSQGRCATAAGPRSRPPAGCRRGPAPCPRAAPGRRRRARSPPPPCRRTSSCHTMPVAQSPTHRRSPSVARPAGRNTFSPSTGRTIAVVARPHDAPQDGVGHDQVVLEADRVQRNGRVVVLEHGVGMRVPHLDRATEPRRHHQVIAVHRHRQWVVSVNSPGHGNQVPLVDGQLLSAAAVDLVHPEQVATNTTVTALRSGQHGHALRHDHAAARQVASLPVALDLRHPAEVRAGDEQVPAVVERQVVQPRLQGRDPGLRPREDIDPEDLTRLVDHVQAPLGSNFAAAGTPKSVATTWRSQSFQGSGVAVHESTSMLITMPTANSGPYRRPSGPKSKPLRKPSGNGASVATTIGRGGSISSGSSSRARRP